MPDKIDSNFTGLNYAVESTAIGVLPGAAGVDAVWKEAEPNSYADFGGSVEKVARSPINSSRQKKKGVTTSLTAAVGVQIDFIQQAVLDYLQTFFFAKVHDKADTKPINGAAIVITSATTTTFTAAAGLGVFAAGVLVLSTGFGVPGNNKLSLLSAAASGAITTTGLTAEASPPAAARVQAVGFQFASGDFVLTYSAGVLTATVTTANLNDKGLNVGEWMFIGGDTSGVRVNDTLTGYARIKTIAAKSITFDKTTFAPAADAGTGKTVQVFYGKFLRNELARNLIVRTTLQWERTLDSDADGVQAEYVAGSVGNEFTLNLPDADKITGDMTFVGIGNDQRTGLEGLKAGARVPITEDMEAYNTSTDLYRSHLSILDPTTTAPTALFAWALEASIGISNNATVNRALTRLAGFDVSVGDFDVTGSITAYFSNILALRAVRQNASVAYDLIAARANQGFIFDIPLLTLSDAKPNVEKDGPVTVPLEIMGAKNVNGYSMAYNHFSYLPTVAMPAVQ